MKIKINLIGQPSSTGRGVGFYHQFLNSSLAKLTGIDLTDISADIDHYTYFDLFYPTLPFKKIRPTVVTVHDLTPLILSHLYPKGLRGSLIVIRQRLALQNAQAIITDSHSSAADLHRIFLIPDSKIHVTPLAVDPLFSRSISAHAAKQVARRYHLPHEFVLTVAAGANPNKNLPLLAQATAHLHIPLVIVGRGLTEPLPPGPLHPELRDLAKLRSFKHLILPGFVPSSDLLSIYKLATLYCQPSLNEGFGLPLLEAMTAGTLIVSANTASLPEIYPQKAITFDPTSLDALTDALEKALNLSDQKKQTLIRISQHRAGDFSWDQTARLTTAVYHQVLAGKH